MSNWSSYKKDQLIMESWRGFLSERKTISGTLGQQTADLYQAGSLFDEFEEVLEELNLEPEVYLPVVQKILKFREQSTELAPYQQQSTELAPYQQQSTELTPYQQQSTEIVKLIDKVGYKNSLMVVKSAIGLPEKVKNTKDLKDLITKLRSKKDQAKLGDIKANLQKMSAKMQTKDRCAKSKIDFIMCMFEASCEVLNLDSSTRKKQLNQLETTLQNPAVDLEKIARELLDKVNKQIEAGIKTAKDCDKLKIKQKKQLSQKIDLGQQFEPRAAAPLRENNEKE
jgi:hypothetical protein